jgi:hypothetical protein
VTDQPAITTPEEWPVEIRRLRSELHRLQVNLAAQAGTAERLAKTEEQLAKRTAELVRARASTAYKLGQILVEGAKRPARAPVVVPRELTRLWRMRRAESRPAPTGVATAVASQGTGDPTLLHVDLSAHLVTAHDRPVVAGVLARGTARAIARATHLSHLRPNDALRIMERIRPDVLLVESAAARWGPWAYLGSYCALERDRLLLALLERAHATGVPAVLWLDTPDGEHPGLVAMSGRFDVVVRSDRATVDGSPWSAGVSLRDFHPVGLTNPEHDVALPAGVRPAAMAHLAAVSEPLRVIEAPDGQLWPDRLAHAYRSTAAYLAVPAAGAATSDPDEVCRALACGARVVVVEPRERAPWIGDDLAPHVHVVADHQAAGVAVLDAARDGRRDNTAARDLLRTLRDHRSVQARIATLLNLVDRGPFSALVQPHVAPLDEAGDAPWVAVVDRPGQDLLAADPSLLRDLVIIAECADADVAGVGSVTEVTTAVADGVLVFRRAALDAADQVPDEVRLTEWARGARRLVTLGVTPLGRDRNVDTP